MAGCVSEAGCAGDFFCFVFRMMYEEEKRGPDLTARGTLIVRVCVDRLNFGPVRRRLLLAFFFMFNNESNVTM